MKKYTLSQALVPLWRKFHFFLFFNNLFQRNSRASHKKLLSYSFTHTNSLGENTLTQQKIQQGLVQCYSIAPDISFPASKLVRNRSKWSLSADFQFRLPHGHRCHSRCKSRVSVASSKIQHAQVLNSHNRARAPLPAQYPHGSQKFQRKLGMP